MQSPQFGSIGSDVLAIIAAPGKIQDKPTEIKAAFDSWVKAQPPWVEGVSSGVFGALQGAFLGALMGTMAKNSMDPSAAAAGGPGMSMMKLGGPMQQARSFAAMTAVNSGLSVYLKRKRGVDDIQNTMISGFFGGACYSLVSSIGNTATAAMPGAMGTPNPLMGAFSAGVVFALFQGGFYKLGEMFGGPKTDDVEYARVKAMLTHLGLSKYERNVKRELLNDTTLLLWDTAALQEAKVPAGPRLLILNHIDRYRDTLTVRDLLNPALPVTPQKSR